MRGTQSRDYYVKKILLEPNSRKSFIGEIAYLIFKKLPIKYKYLKNKKTKNMVKRFLNLG